MRLYARRNLTTKKPPHNLYQRYTIAEAPKNEGGQGATLVELRQ
jgi:DNA-nicking Smr family endonuclease